MSYQARFYLNRWLIHMDYALVLFYETMPKTTAGS